MGVTFRSGEYVRFVRFGHRTIKDGEAAAVWNARGELTQVVGPRRVTLWFSTIRFLHHKAASHGQYLQVKHRNGQTKHVLGPCAMYLNPAHHQSIQVCNGYNLATEDDCLVIYGGSDSQTREKGMEASRRIAYGPQFVIPSEQETVHTFQWSRAGGGNFETSHEANSRNHAFQILQTNKNEPLYKIVDLKTTQGPSVQVELAICYKVESVEKCLTVADPIAHLSAAMLSDAVSNPNNITLTNVTEKAGQLTTYPSFCEALQSCGIRMVSLRVTKLTLPKSVTDRLSSEKKEHDQRLRDQARLEHDMKLTQLELEKKRGQVEAQATLDKLQSQLQSQVAQGTHSMRKAAPVENELSVNQLRRTAAIEALREANEARLHYLRGLSDMGVDVTKVLCTEQHAAVVAGKKGGQFITGTKDTMGNNEEETIHADNSNGFTAIINPVHF